MKTKIKILALFAITLIASSCKKDKMGNETVTDYDGNVYQTIKIGTQEWMVENLKTSHYNDGIVIPTGLNGSAWLAATYGAYAFYDDNPLNNDVYGKLYNWYAVNTGKLAPKGWHVPTDAEWTTLTNYLGGECGTEMKSTSGWILFPGIVNSNSSGFMGLPGGGRTAIFQGLGTEEDFWSSTGYSIGDAFLHTLVYDDSGLGLASGPKTTGYSIRCVKD